MKDPEIYQLEIKQIVEFFNGKRVLTKTDVMNYTGRGRKWLDSHFPRRSEWTAVELALDMTKKVF